ncbi:MAG: chaperone modulatory protein CbpM [Bradyrhizobium sp.]|jgi:chaperone modulatory protein CbpM
MNRHQFLTHAGLEVQTLEFWIEQQWLVPDQSSDEVTFSDTDVARAHLIQDLKGDFGVNDEGIDVILHLVDQLHGLRKAFAELHDDLAQRP